MEFSLNRKELKTALTALKPCLPAKPLNELEANMLIKVSPTGGLLIATDMVQEGVMPLTLVTAPVEPLEILPDIKKLEKVLAKTDSEEVEMSYQDGTGILRVASGKGFVDVPTLPPKKLGRYDAPMTEGELLGAVPSSVLADGLSYVSCFMPETITGNLKFEVAILEGGLLSAANGWNRRGFFVSTALKLPKELKILQRFAECLPKLLRHVPGQLNVILHERSIVLTSENGFRYSCVRAKHETPAPVLSYLRSNDPYLVVEMGKLVKILDKVVVPDYQAAGAPVGVAVTVPPAEAGSTASTMELELVSTGNLQARDTIPCTREGETATPGGELIEKVIDYRMFKAIASQIPSKSDTRVYMSNPACRFFKFQSKFMVDTYPCVAVAVGTYSKRIGHAAQ